MSYCKPIEWYNVEERTPYSLVIEKVELEDLGDDFINTEELSEMGITYIHSGKMSITNKPAIKSALEYWVSQIPPGKNSVVINDVALIEVLDKAWEEFRSSISWFLEGKYSDERGAFVRRRNVLYRNRPKPKKTLKIDDPHTEQDVRDLIFICVEEINKKFGIRMSVSMPSTPTELPAFITMLTTAVSWDTIEKYIEFKYIRNGWVPSCVRVDKVQGLARLKKLYKTPSLASTVTFRDR